MVRITTLIDNRGCDRNSPELLCEHGLSFIIELAGLKILCDLGASNAFASNANILGFDIADVDLVVLSHAHADHTGGLRYMLENSTAPIYLSSRVFGHRYYSTRHTSKRDISCDETLYVPYSQRYRMVAESQIIAPNVSLVYCNTSRYSRPIANSHLRVEPIGGVERVDNFAHEIALVITTPRGLVIVSSCSHCGAANIIASCQEFSGEERVVAFVGGLHFVDGEYSQAEVNEFVETIRELTPDTIFYTGHCTGSHSQELLQELLPDTIRPFYTGHVVEL